jgi:hypothetical protein
VTLPIAAMIGCGHPAASDPYVPTDVKISRLVLDMDDFSQDPRELEIAVPRLFAVGCEPSEKELHRYGGYHYEGKPPVQKGDTATVVVIIKNAKSGNSEGEFTWKAKKVTEVKGVYGTNDSAQPGNAESAAGGGKTDKEIWKLTEAPLPAK